MEQVRKCQVNDISEKGTNLVKVIVKIGTSNGVSRAKYVTLSAKTSLMLGVHKAGFRKEGHI